MNGSSDREPSGVRRRTLLGLLGLAALPAALPGRAQAAAAYAAEQLPQNLPEGVTLLVAGPDGGTMERWASALAPDLAHGLPNAAAFNRLPVGGADGVTGANQFEARAQPDGKAALLLPGSAALSWLVGDPRAQFDIGHWVPLLAALGPILLVGRPDLQPLAAETPLRIAAESPAGTDLPGLLALFLLKMKAEPVFGLSGSAATDAYAAGRVDALILSGPAVQAPLPGGSVPLLRLDAATALTDAQSPATLGFPALAAQRGVTDQPLFEAWRAATTAAALQAALVLPRLTPAATVALWRHAASDAAGATAAKAMATADNARLLDGTDASDAMQPLQAGVPAQLALHEWLGKTYNWRPA